MDIGKIGGNLVRCVASGELCRLWSTDLSEVKPQLDAHNVRLCGIGLEELGLEEFQEGNFFTGELFIDAKQTCYKELGFRRYNLLTVVKGLLAPETKQSIARGNSKNIKGNYRGDGLQNGGMLIVTAGGKKALLSFKQSSPGDHVSNERILEILGIGAEPAKEESAGAVAGSQPSEGATACAKTGSSG